MEFLLESTAIYILLDRGTVEVSFSNTGHLILIRVVRTHLSERLLTVGLVEPDKRTPF